VNTDITALSITAATIGFFHTLLGPDHYLPFVVIARARSWSIKKTVLITGICGLGHIISSLIIGSIGILAGAGIAKMEFLESFRGNIASMALIAFGVIYFVWGMRNAYKGKEHSHAHLHGDGSAHHHHHDHHDDHSHIHEVEGTETLTTWALFLIFIFGPCEPLIPMLIYPAAKGSLTGVLWISGVFSIVTLMTMTALVTISLSGIHLLPIKRIERYTHAIAGGTICLCGIAIQFLGL